MTIASDLAKAAYLTDGVTTSFAVPFRFLAASHLRVIEVRGGAQTELPASAWTVSGAGAPAGGAVTIPPPLAANGQLVILRQVPITQETHYPKNDPFPEQAHEAALDKLTMIAQQQGETLTRAVVLPVSDPRTPAQFIEDFFKAAQDARNAATGAASSEANAAASADTASDAAQAAQDRWDDIRSKFTVSTDPPSGGKDGDIWFQVI